MSVTKLDDNDLTNGEPSNSDNCTTMFGDNIWFIRMNRRGRSEGCSTSVVSCANSLNSNGDSVAGDNGNVTKFKLNSFDGFTLCNTNTMARRFRYQILVT